MLADRIFKVDFRFWVLGLKPLDQAHFAIFLAYLVPWIVYFWVTLRALTAALPPRSAGALTQYAYAIFAMAGGFVALLLVQYGYLFETGMLLTPTEPLNVIVAIQFVPLMTALAILTVFTYRRTRTPPRSSDNLCLDRQLVHFRRHRHPLVEGFPHGHSWRRKGQDIGG